MAKFLRGDTTQIEIETLREALTALEQIAKRSTDKSSRAIASGAAGSIRAKCDALVLDP